MFENNNNLIRTKY